MPHVLVAGGSNIDAPAHVRRAKGLLCEAFPGVVSSTVVANPPVGFTGEDFLNWVVGFDTQLALADVLVVLHGIEAECGRERDAPKWAPRSMDLDVLLYGDAVGEFPGAVLPRPDLIKRPYMLGLAAEIAPQVVHPTLGQSLDELWQAFDKTGWAPRIVSL